jgi:hypothetical protein
MRGMDKKMSGRPGTRKKGRLRGSGLIGTNEADVRRMEDDGLEMGVETGMVGRLPSY